MNSRIDKAGLMAELLMWNGFLKRKVHLIACGGTAMTLMGVKPSTDISEKRINKNLDYFLDSIK